MVYLYCIRPVDLLENYHYLQCWVLIFGGWLPVDMRCDTDDISLC